MCLSGLIGVHIGADRSEDVSARHETVVTALPAGLFLALVAGLPVGVLALCGATVGTALRAKTGWRSAALLGTAGPAVGLVLAHAAPTGPVRTGPAGAAFVTAALVGGGWTLVRGPRA